MGMGLGMAIVQDQIYRFFYQGIINEDFANLWQELPISSRLLLEMRGCFEGFGLRYSL
jgi:hypothetical protein